MRKTEECARKGVENALIGPEPTCGIAYGVAQASVSVWVSNIHQEHWHNTDGYIEDPQGLHWQMSSV